jgi:hypothetical protein
VGCFCKSASANASLYPDRHAESLRLSFGFLNSPIRFNAEDAVADASFPGFLYACKAAAKKWLYAVSSQVMEWLAICVTYPRNSTTIEAARV